MKISPRATRPAIVFILAAALPASALAQLSPAIEGKLTLHWSAYETARKTLIEKVGQDGKILSRTQWEKMLAPGANGKLSAAETASLKKEQSAAIAAAKEKAKAASSLQLSSIRSAGRSREFCEKIPKGGMLHVHPWGTADRATVEAILAKVDPSIPTAKLEESLGDPNAEMTIAPQDFEFLKAYPDGVKYSALKPADREKLVDLFFLDGPKSHSFARFLGVFELLSKLFFSNPGVKPDEILWDGFFSRAKKLKIKYVEVSHNANGKPAAIKNWEKWSKDAKSKYGIEAKAIAAFNRMADPQKNAELMDQVLALPKSDAFVGINLVADEGAYPALESAQAIYGKLLAAQAEGSTKLQGTIHAGELGDARNLRDSIVFGVKRIGHGVKLMEDPVALEYAARNRMAIEANILSNQRLGVVKKPENHPFLKMQRLGLKVSFSTDDEGIFVTDLADECAAAIDATDIEYSELRQILRNSLETSFAGETLKKSLLKDFDAETNAFEQSWQ